MASFYAGEDIDLAVQWTDRDQRPLCPVPSLGVTIAVKSQDEKTTHLASAAAALVVEEGGTSTGTNTSTTLKDTTKKWAVGQWKDNVVTITAGLGAGQQRRIQSNTTDTLTLYGQGTGADTPVSLRTWATTPDASSKYEIHKSEYVRTWASPASLANTVVRAVATAKDALYPNGNTEKVDLHLEGAA